MKFGSKVGYYAKGLGVASAIAFAGCFMPGAPHHYFYHSATNHCDSLRLTSYPKSTEYEYLPCTHKVDSLLLFEPLLKKYVKLTFDPNSGNYYYHHNESIAEVKKVEGLHYLNLLKFYHGRMEHDSLLAVHQK